MQRGSIRTAGSRNGFRREQLQARRGDDGRRDQQRGNRERGDQQGQRRKRRAHRRCGRRSDLGLRVLQQALLVGRLVPRQELLVDVFVGVRVTLQLLQPDERLTVDQDLRFYRFQLVFKALLLVALGLIFRLAVSMFFFRSISIRRLRSFNWPYDMTRSG